MLTRSKVSTAVAGLVAAWSLAAAPAHAQYWGYWPWSYYPFGFGTSAYWPLRAVLSPLRLAGLGGTPYYLVSRAVGGSVPYYAMAHRQPIGMSEYVDDEPLAGPRRRVRPVRAADDPTDVTAKARWTKPDGWPQPQVDYLQAAPGSPAPPPPPAPPPHPAPGPQPGPGPGSGPQPLAEPASSSPVAAEPPLVQGFIALVNSRFDGDIARALADPDARHWAQALGIIVPSAQRADTFPAERVALVRQILKDHSLTGKARLDAVRALLGS